MGHIYWSCCLNATCLSPLATAKALGLDIPPTMLALTSDGADGDGVGRSGEKPGPSAQRFVNGSDTICSSGFGVTASCPAKGRSWAAISSAEADTPVANNPIASNDASRSSQCTNAIASRAHIACR